MKPTKRYLFGALVLAGLCACSKEPGGEPAPGVPVPILTTAALPGDGTKAVAEGAQATTYGTETPTDGQKAVTDGAKATTDGTEAPTDTGIPTDSAQATSIATKAVADPAKALTLYFARADQNTSGVYAAYGTTAISAARPAGTGAQTLTFTPAQYYLATRKASKLTGWYPAATSFTGGVVSWTLDGSQDVMTAPAREGSLTSAKMAFTFGHRLTQLQFCPYAENAEAQAAWGNITAIAVTSQPNTCTYTLSANGSDGAVAFGASLASFGVKNLTAARAPVGIANAVQAGDAVMIAPHDDLYSVRVTVTSSVKGAVSIMAPARTYAAGSVIRMKLKFTRLTYYVEPEISIDDWVPDSTTDVKTDPVSEPDTDITDWEQSGNTELN